MQKRMTSLKVPTSYFNPPLFPGHSKHTHTQQQTNLLLQRFFLENKLAKGCLRLTFESPARYCARLLQFTKCCSVTGQWQLKPRPTRLTSRVEQVVYYLILRAISHARPRPCFSPNSCFPVVQRAVYSLLFLLSFLSFLFFSLSYSLAWSLFSRQRSVLTGSFVSNRPFSFDEKI